jgi:hypothetical protein
MDTIQYHLWCPPASRVRIEFAAELLRQIQAPATQDHERGILFGERRGDHLRVLAARHGLEPVGIFVNRIRGEIFLTDPDLAYMEQQATDVALVVAGVRAGFFVREPDGSLQAVRSYEEFSTLGPPPRLEPPLPRVHSRWLMAAAGILAVPAAAFAYFHPLGSEPPIPLEAREEAGQLIVTWDPRSLTSSASLEIVDHGRRTTVSLEKATGSATYQLNGGDVEVRLATQTRTGSFRRIGR